MKNEANNEQGSTGKAPVVLVVEDDPLTRRAVGVRLQSAGYEVIMVPNAGEALIVAQREAFQVLVLDLHLVEDAFSGIHEGFAVIDWLRHQLGGELQFRIVIYTSQSGPQVMEKAEARGAFAFCTKRRDMSNLLQCVADAVESLKAA